jgi:Ca-activated chloride channel family protein
LFGIPTACAQSLTARGIHGATGVENAYAHVTIFGIEAKGSKFVYVFDRSGSMEGVPLAAAKKQLLESLQPLGETQQFEILFFNHRVSVFDSSSGSKRATFATDRNKQLAAEFVQKIAADGGTDRFLALRRALALQPDVVFFLSDEDKPMPAKELDEIARTNDRVGAQICAIEFGRGEKPPSGSSMAELAQANNGKYVYVDVAKLSK